MAAAGDNLSMSFEKLALVGGPSPSGSVNGGSDVSETTVVKRIDLRTCGILGCNCPKPFHRDSFEAGTFRAGQKQLTAVVCSRTANGKECAKAGCAYAHGVLTDAAKDTFKKSQKAAKEALAVGK